MTRLLFYLCGTLLVSYTSCECNLPKELIEEIQGYEPIVNIIINEIVYGSFQNSTYNELAKFVDTFGNRVAGSQNLENAIDYMLNVSEAAGLDNVHGEEVLVPHWVRGEESATLLKPRRQNLRLLDLGGTVSTPKEGITAEVLVVTSFEELEQPKIATQANGKIVLFVPEFVSYGTTVKYRGAAASTAAKHGAVAALVRSIAPFSINSPHTGWQTYEDGITKIPVAALTVEDAHMLLRMKNRGEKIVVQLSLQNQMLDPVVSRNTVLELKGSESPEKVVMVSGHLDSWDVGEGAMDDGGGSFISWNSLVILKALGLRARRTLRAILWTAEEPGIIGAEAYDVAHKNETDDWMFLMESDIGTFNPLGLDITTGENGACIIEEILNLLKPINTTQLRRQDEVGSDIGIWTGNGIPG